MSSGGLQIQQVKGFDFDAFELQLKNRVAKEFRGHGQEWKHTLDVVKNIKRLVTLEGGKLDLLVCTAYLHELGHLGVMGDGAVMFPDKPVFIQRGLIAGQKARQILAELGFDGAKVEQVARLLETNSCIELKRAHHHVE